VVIAIIAILIGPIGASRAEGPRGRQPFAMVSTTLKASSAWALHSFHDNAEKNFPPGQVMGPMPEAGRDPASQSRFGEPFHPAPILKQPASSPPQYHWEVKTVRSLEPGSQVNPVADLPMPFGGAEPVCTTAGPGGQGRVRGLCPHPGPSPRL